MSYRGYYINLARSPERRAEVESQFARHGLAERYARFEAADGNSLKLANPHLKEGEIGCFISHYLVLKKNLDRTEPLHVVEDDVVLSQHTRPVIDAVLGEELAKYDLVFTDTYVPLHPDFLKAYKAQYDRNVARDAAGTVVGARFEVIELGGRPFATTTSYLVNGRSIRKLYNILSKEIANSPKLPIDLFIRNKARDGVIKVGCVFPFVTSFRLDPAAATTIAGRHDALSLYANNLARHSFFIDAEPARWHDEAARLLVEPETDAHARLLAILLGFTVSPRCRPI